ncbi:MAG TPA: hypothetical protein VER79_10410 [Candidatus Limnocylindrales bacterium]|nr:hypothetical protein [Candidatus Limnocylindrales bacterium]
MRSQQFAQRVTVPVLRRKPRHGEEELIAPVPAPHRLIQLQQSIGNSGVRALLAQNAGSAVQREPAIQRFWGDEEEEGYDNSEDGGGSWVSDLYDSASELVTDGANAVQDATDAAFDWASGGSEEKTESGGDSVNMGPGPESESGGEEKSWWDQASDEVESWFEEDEEASEAEGGEETSWWDELWSEDEEESSEGEEEKSWWDQLWDNDEEEVTDEPPREIEDISAECKTQNGVGHGGGKSIKLHGLTTSNYNHAKPLPAPFPSGVKVTERKVKVSKTVEQDVFDAKGTFDVTFASNPSISLPTVPSDLTPCQEKAVQAFISGPLTAHENDHKSAFETNYDGSFTATVDVSNIKDTPEMRQRALENPVMAEDKRRADLANSESKKLDPWKETVSGLDCKEPEKKPNAAP